MYYTEKISLSFFDSIAGVFGTGSAHDSLLHTKLIACNNNFKAQKILENRKAAEAFPFAKKAVVHHADVDSRRLMVGAISQLIVCKQWSVSAVLDSIRMIDTLVPGMRDNELWVPIYLEVISIKAWSDVLNNDFASAKLLLQEFEAQATPEYVAVMDKTNLEKLYGRVLMDYYKRDRKQAARTLATGLLYMPESEILGYYKKKLNI